MNRQGKSIVKKCKVLGERYQEVKRETMEGESQTYEEAETHEVFKEKR